MARSRLIRRMSLVVDRYELGPIGTNCYVVRLERGAAEAVVVDPGDDASGLRLELARMGTRCAAILITHGHWDHIGGVADLAEGTGAPVYMPEVERITLEDPRSVFPDVSIRSWTPDTTLDGGEEVEAAGISFETVAVPGHSPGHLAYYAGGCLFSGDVLFAGSVGRTDLPFGDWDTLLESIRSLVDRFPSETVVYSGHGPPTTLGAELARNPFLAELRTS
jgi:hydroxyacylglutathione hydrolase